MFIRRRVSRQSVGQPVGQPGHWRTVGYSGCTV